MYRFLQTVEPSVIVEFPVQVYAPTYMFWSTYHWHSLINGYSGYIPGDAIDTQTMMETFPDDESVARLRALRVRFVLVHEAFYRPDDYTDLMEAIARRPELVPGGRYRDWVGETQMFEVRIKN